MKNRVVCLLLLVALGSIGGCERQRLVLHDSSGAGTYVAPLCSFAPAGKSSSWLQSAPTTTHVIDGRFTGDEWANAYRLEGMFTDVYLDYESGYLYMLNDWRVNPLGIREDCYNEFILTVGCETVDLKVFGDGHVTVNGDHPADGAYAFSSSPRYPTPHTIWEFRVAVDAGDIAVSCFDPVTFTSCEELKHEPVVFSIHAKEGGSTVSRTVPDDVPRLADGSSCANNTGLCDEGSSCEPSNAGMTCTPASPPDAGATM